VSVKFLILTRKINTPVISGTGGGEGARGHCDAPSITIEADVHSSDRGTGRGKSLKIACAHPYKMKSPFPWEQKRT